MGCRGGSGASSSAGTFGGPGSLNICPDAMRHPLSCFFHWFFPYSLSALEKVRSPSKITLWTSSLRDIDCSPELAISSGLSFLLFLQQLLRVGEPREGGGGEQEVGDCSETHISP